MWPPIFKKYYIYKSKKCNGKERNTSVGNGTKDPEQNICSAGRKNNAGQGFGWIIRHINQGFKASCKKEYSKVP